jgi:hypothetical protein
VSRLRGQRPEEPHLLHAELVPKACGRAPSARSRSTRARRFACLCVPRECQDRTRASRSMLRIQCWQGTHSSIWCTWPWRVKLRR